jgi:uncharacterized protein (TIGR00730 family)
LKNSFRPEAHHNSAFLKSDEARPLRILAEYLEPYERLRAEKIQDTVVFFGSARLQEQGPLGHYYQAARELAGQLTQWAQTLPGAQRFVICTGGGPGIMEAANRGATEAGGRTIGFNIGLPHEQRPNPYLSPDLTFQFHYFFMRKLWFSHLARALVVFPGGFGTLDELMEILTLVQTGKLVRKIKILLYGSSFWQEVINFKALVHSGMIEAKDLELFTFVDDVPSAFKILRASLPTKSKEATPAIAKSKSPRDRR